MRVDMTSASTERVIPTDPKGKPELGPGRALYEKVMGGLISNGRGRFARWCRGEGLDPQRVRAALFGLSDTDEARALRERAMRAAGLLADNPAA